eukprot:5150809-Prorocentrum_lima.AAC.1
MASVRRPSLRPPHLAKRVDLSQGYLSVIIPPTKGGTEKKRRTGSSGLFNCRLLIPFSFPNTLGHRVP